MRPRTGARCLRLALTALALSLGGGQAENFFELRYFGPSGGLAGLQASANFSLQAQNLNLQLHVPQLSLDVQQATFSLSAGSYYAYASVAADAFSHRAGLTGLLGYSAPQPGLLTDASLTLARALDGSETGYALTSLALDLRGKFSPAWGWNLNAAQDTLTVLAAPDAPSLNRSLTLGVQGKPGRLDLRARARLSLDSQSPDVLRWNVNAQAGLPLSDTEHLNAELEYDRLTFDRERLNLISTRLNPLSLNAGLSRADGLLRASLGASYPVGEHLSLSASYGLTLGAPASHTFSLSADAQQGPWTLSAGLDADLTPDVNSVLEPGVSAQLTAAYVTDTLGFSLRGNARYSAGQPWTYHLDAQAQHQSGPFTLRLGLAADSPSASQPLRTSAEVETLYRLSAGWQLSASARYRLGTTEPALQFGLGARYAF